MFKTLYILFSIPFILAFILWLRARQKQTAVRVSSSELFSGIKPTFKMRFKAIPFILRLVILVLFLLALAGPRSVKKETIQKSEGIDIVLTIDASGSMAGEDFVIENRRVNRLTVVKDVVSDFISKRSHDRIGLIAFAGLAYTVCPLTTDYDWLEKNLERVELGLIKDGTAIGSAIASSVSRLKNSNAKSKIIILLTDGVNNAGKTDPLEAARAAAAFGIRIYTIGAGTKGYVPYPMTDFYGRKAYQNVLIELDEEVLREIADISGGKYYRATDTQSLRQIYEQIDKLEKTEIEELGYLEYDELFPVVLMIALGLLFVEMVLKETLFLRIP